MDSTIDFFEHGQELTCLRLGDGKNNHTSFFGKICDHDIVALFVLENDIREDGSHGDGTFGRLLGGGVGLGVVGVVRFGL